MQGVLQQVGFAGALLAREVDDGTLELIDGHLRAGMADDQQVPVLVVDIDRSEADLLLATHDPIGEMAGTDQSALNSLLADLDSSNNEVSELLTELANRTGEPIQFETIEPDLSPIFQVIVDCENEQGQKEIYEMVTAKGYTCRIVSI